MAIKLQANWGLQVPVVPDRSSQNEPKVPTLIPRSFPETAILGVKLGATTELGGIEDIDVDMYVEVGDAAQSRGGIVGLGGQTTVDGSRFCGIDRPGADEGDSAMLEGRPRGEARIALAQQSAQHHAVKRSRRRGLGGV